MALSWSLLERVFGANLLSWGYYLHICTYLIAMARDPSDPRIEMLEARIDTLTKTSERGFTAVVDKLDVVAQKIEDLAIATNGFHQNFNQLARDNQSVNQRMDRLERVVEKLGDRIDKLTDVVANQQQTTNALIALASRLLDERRAS